MLMPHRLRMADFSCWRRSPLRPEMKNDAVCLGSCRGHFLRLIFRHIQHLYTPGRNFHLMVMVELVPDVERQFARNGLGDKIFDVRQDEAGG